MSTKRATKKRPAAKRTQRSQQSLLTVVIKASQWARGKKRGRRRKWAGDTNSLLNYDGSKCCLGIDASVCGLLDDQILDKPMPTAVTDTDDNDDIVGPYIGAWKQKIEGEDGDRHEAQELAVDINDDEGITDDERIRRLRSVFAAVKPPRRIVWRPDL